MALSTIEITDDGTYLPDLLCDVPKQLSVFTLPITFKLSGVNILVTNIAKYYPLEHDNIIEIKCGNVTRKLNVTVKDIKDGGDNDANFMNQLSLVMIIYTDKTHKKTKEINIKLFDNNSVQITGLLSIYQCNHAINKLIRLLSKEKGFFVDKITKEVSPYSEGNVKFVSMFFLDGNKVSITQPKISTINLAWVYRRSKATQFILTRIFYKVKELRLTHAIPSNILIRYQPDINSSFKLQFEMDDGSIVTISIFESGKILFMACKNQADIINIYTLVNNILTMNENYILKRNEKEELHKHPELLEYVDYEKL